MKAIGNSIAFLAFFFFILAGIAGAYAQEESTCIINLDTDKDTYLGPEKVLVFGNIEGCDDSALVDYALEVRMNNKVFFADQKKTDYSGNLVAVFVTDEKSPAEYMITVSTRYAKATKTISVVDKDGSIDVYSSKSDYLKGETVRISGTINVTAGEYDENAAILVKDDKGNIAYINEAEVSDDGTFSVSFKVKPGMRNGMYTVYAAWNGYLDIASFFVYPNVVINEVMFYPPEGSDTDEFVELYNPLGDDLDISGWYITSPGEVMIILDWSVIEARGFEVISPIAFGLPDVSGTINLFDADGNMIDSFNYRASLCADLDSDDVPDCEGEGATLQRIDAFELTNLYSNWGSGAIGGTPGRANTVAMISGYGGGIGYVEPTAIGSGKATSTGSGMKSSTATTSNDGGNDDSSDDTDGEDDEQGSSDEDDTPDSAEQQNDAVLFDDGMVSGEGSVGALSNEPASPFSGIAGITGQAIAGYIGGNATIIALFIALGIGIYGVSKTI